MLHDFCHIIVEIADASMIERQDPNGIHAHTTSLPMPGQMREPLGTVDMHPMQFAMHAHARLVHMLKPSTLRFK